MKEAVKVYLDRGLHGREVRLGRIRQGSRLGCATGGSRARGARRPSAICWSTPAGSSSARRKRRSRWCGRIEPFQPFLVEELLHPEDYDGYRQVAEAVETRIACGEQEATEWGFQQLIERGRVDVLQPDLTRCGGFTVARKIVHMAERANRLVIPHSWSSDLLTAASLHLTAFQRRAAFVEFNTSQGPLSRLLVKEPLRMEDGFVRSRRPGLGVEVNDAVIEQYRVA